MKPPILLLALLAIVLPLTLGACGQKGPLYLPAKPTALPSKPDSTSADKSSTDKASAAQTKSSTASNP